jgi:hypothetical protein
MSLLLQLTLHFIKKPTHILRANQIPKLAKGREIGRFFGQIEIAKPLCGDIFANESLKFAV